jgi:CheY-like chemotaxis protein
MANDGMRGVLLRAETVHSGRRIVTHTTEIGAGAVTLEIPDPPAVGTMLTLSLSFPRLVGPFGITVQVTEVRRESGPGAAATIRCDVVGASEEARAFLASLGEETAHGAGRRASPYRCLLVEDNNFIRDLFAYGMDRYGQTRGGPVSLALAGDVEQAWEMLAGSEFDMAIVDFYLPTHIGSTLIARVRATPRLAGMPIVAISVGGNEAREASIAAGADLFLDKPLVMRDLFTTLDLLTLREAAR